MVTYLMMIDAPADQSKFEKIYTHYKGLMYHVAFQILNNREDAEDAVHDAFVKIAENITKIEEAMCPKTQHFIITIVENRAIDIYRRNSRRKTKPYDDDFPGVPVNPEKTYGLSHCMAQLPVRYREVILLKYYHGFTCKEIAKIMNITVANAIKLDQRAKQKLYQICKEEGEL